MEVLGRNEQPWKVEAEAMGDYARQLCGKGPLNTTISLAPLQTSINSLQIGFPC